MSTTPSFLRAAPTLPVAEVTASIAYFVEALRFEKRFVNNDDGPVYAIVGRDTVEIHLERNCEGAAGRCACCVFVSGIEALFDEMKSHGARIERALSVAPYGMKEFLLSDLDGNKILVGETTS